MEFLKENIHWIVAALVIIVVLVVVYRMMRPKEQYHNGGRGPADERGLTEGRGPYIGDIINANTAYDDHDC